MQQTFLLTFCGFTFVFIVCSSESEKRLLITDQNVVQTLTEELRLLKTKFTKLENAQTRLMSDLNKGRAVYTRWGKKTCPSFNETSIVYSGITGGKAYYQKGSGVTTLCLPHDPEPVPTDFPTRPFSDEEGTLWGSEYQFSFRKIAHDDDVPCAVCQVTSQTTIMIPAKRTCPTGWKKEYSGILIGTNAQDYPSEYICMDENPDFFEGTRSHDDNGRTLYPIRTVCGSLPCPPYGNHQFVSCVVCSQ
ncbi:uncharacterized protein LOC134278542 [Saccostrea cucullata]|uniref:uncharacterized protein LOC134278542 n=1 Tax=Saccostrea cuccullata TaxID=36930 RepID=UPI002ED1514E